MGEVRNKLKIRKGDRVVVLKGKDVGKQGEVTRVLTDKRRVIVEGINMARRHQKATRATMQGGIIDKDMPIDISNVALVCSTCGATRVGYRFDEEGKKVRICRKCGGDV
ncbi:MAG: 50S ribosomal protein L24 [Actinobacteria bacterium]|nr:50S ribosomal protein L24 [Actinomycetota bacterium]